MTQTQLRDAFYAAYEPEVEVSVELFSALHSDDRHRKMLRKFSRTYLLDKLDLNTKCRCVFSWAGSVLIDSTLNPL